MSPDSRGRWLSCRATFDKQPTRLAVSPPAASFATESTASVEFIDDQPFEESAMLHRVMPLSISVSLPAHAQAQQGRAYADIAVEHCFDHVPEGVSSTSRMA